MIETCGCCEGVDAVTPIALANRPGLSALAYRVGTHPDFLATMKARLGSLLRELTTRAADDPSIALLDAWATVADVLTFYQERIANEGYLRTALERRSILELAKLVGYELRPGVAASVYLAYSLDDNYKLTLPKQSRSQSVPGPGEQMQSFETSSPLEMRAEWNTLPVRMTRPQRIAADQVDKTKPETIYFQGTSTNLRPNDLLLFVFGEKDKEQVPRFVATVEAQFDQDPTKNRTKVTLVVPPKRGAIVPDKSMGLDDLLDQLVLGPSKPPADPLRAAPSPDQRSASGSDNAAGILSTFQPILEPILYTAWGGANVSPPPRGKIYAMRIRAGVFGDTAPLKAVPFRVFARLAGHVNRGTVLEKIQASVTVGNQTFASPVSDPPTDARPLVLGNDAERIEVRVTPDDAGWPAALVSFTFVSRSNLVVNLQIDGQRNLIVTIQGDPSSVQVGPGQIVASPGPAILVATTGNFPNAAQPNLAEQEKVLWLDANYDQVLPNTWTVIERPGGVQGANNAAINAEVITRITKVDQASRADYGISAKVTRLEVEHAWSSPKNDTFDIVRATTVYAQTEELALAEEPIDDPICGDPIELAELYDGLDPGRWLIISGERVISVKKDGVTVPGTSGVQATELVMLAGVQQGFDAKLPGDKTHTSLLLTNKLAYCYKRDTIKIYGNVVDATHGETRAEILGSGSGAVPFQSFTLKQSPLTYVSAATSRGIASTLQIRVNDVLWHETDSLAGLAPIDHRFVTQTDDSDKITVTFGDGAHGARLPTGVENVKGTYRIQIGKPGNVRAGQITLLAARPLGVKSVNNPMPATGGADREDLDDARQNVPTGISALDRLVSVADFADFTRAFAGVGKSYAAQLSDGHRQVVHVTVAGADDIPIDETSDLYQNLLLALQQYGDPQLPVRLAVRELLMLVIRARIRLNPDYDWDLLKPQIEQALVAAFGFKRRALGQPVFRSEIISAIQNVAGVDYVDVYGFGGIPEKVIDPPNTTPRYLTHEEIVKRLQDLDATPPAGPPEVLPVNLPALEGGVLRPAQIALLMPEVSATLLLTEMN